MSTRQTAIIAGLVALIVSGTVLGLLLRYGIWEYMLLGKTDLRVILWPSSIMITIGWCSTAAGIMTTISSIAINCLLYIGVALSLRRCFQWFRSVKFLLVLVIVLTIRVAHAQVQPCTPAEAGRALDNALDAADMPRSWDALRRSYKKFGNCDDGAVAEGYSESVARIFADHWKTLPRFAQLAKNDPPFRAFVIRHIDATLNMDDVEKIKKAALTHCPPGLRKTCSDIAKQADRAVKDSASP